MRKNRLRESERKLSKGFLCNGLWGNGLGYEGLGKRGNKWGNVFASLVNCELSANWILLANSVLAA